MRRLSLRRSLLTAVARVLERWLGVVTAGLEPESPPEAPRPPADPRQPPPPDHWVELVRQHAPQLLDSESSGGDSSLVIDWRSDAAEVDAPSPVPPPTPQVRPLRLHPSRLRHTPPVATRTTAPAGGSRPLRLERVAVEALNADDITAHTAASATPPPTPSVVRTTERPVTTTIPIHASGTPERDFSAAVERFSGRLPEQTAPPEVRTSAPVAAPLRQRRLFGVRLPSLRLPSRRARAVPGVPETPIAPRAAADLPREAALREVSTAPVQVDRLSPHFSGTSFERQHVRETRSSIPEQPRLTSVATRVGGDVPTHQQRTNVPGAPPQLVVRPTHVYPALNVDDITPDRWASLPDSPAEMPHDTTGARYERLRREQEGRAWSE